MAAAVSDSPNLAAAVPDPTNLADAGPESKIKKPGIKGASVGDPDPESQVCGPPGSGSISQRYGSGSGSLYYPSIIKQN